MRRCFAAFVNQQPALSSERWVSAHREFRVIVGISGTLAACGVASITPYHSRIVRERRPTAPAATAGRRLVSDRPVRRPL